jgi:hypothetical protein
MDGCDRALTFPTRVGQLLFINNPQASFVGCFDNRFN